MQDPRYKACERCGQPFHKSGQVSYKQWAARRFCSYDCARAAGRQERPLCACGCGEPVRCPSHKWKHGHNRPPLWRCYVDLHGNPRWYVPSRGERRGGRSVPWARIVMQNELGRPLASDEVVHHINGDTEDDRPENLEVLTNAEHTRLHMENGDYHRLTIEEQRRRKPRAGKSQWVCVG